MIQTHLAANLPHKIFAILLGEVLHRRDISKAGGELIHYDFPAGVCFSWLSLCIATFLCALCAFLWQKIEV